MWLQVSLSAASVARSAFRPTYVSPRNQTEESFNFAAQFFDFSGTIINLGVVYLGLGPLLSLFKGCLHVRIYDDKFPVKL